ncbi:hypothetical protein [Mesorhizobium marinum]|uniref:Uncharacterized protein n=1 Tax=Mesorhizobium marinum TaxID=3228790 RepID=A0ABV3QY60_9HYPH
MKRLAILVATATFAASIGAMKADASPLSDCYDEVISSCGYLWPGQDSGDAGYSSCISSGMDLCDGAHKSVGAGKIKGFKAVKPRAKLKFRAN